MYPTPSLLPRKIVPSALEEPCLSQDAFSVCTLNVLCDTYCRADSYLPSLCDPAYLKWEYRRDLILAEILRCSPDIICLQEVEYEAFRSFFEPNLRSLGYIGVYRQKANRVPGEFARPDGVALFYRASRFVLEVHLEIDLESPEFGVITDWPQCAQVASLRFISSVAKRVVVGNTHFKANDTPVDERVRNAQAAIFLNQIHTFINTFRLGEPPIIICGDFNSRPTSNVYKLFTQGVANDVEVGYQPNVFKHLQHPFNLSSAYRHLHTLKNANTTNANCDSNITDHPPDAPFTMRMPGWEVTYDYIFYSQDWLRVVQLLDIPDERTWNEKCLPAWNYGSDHLSLVAWFDWIEECLYY